MKKITFEISTDAYALLLNIHENKLIEFRNLDSDDFIDKIELIDELLKCGLLNDVLDAWHLTFKVSEFGKEIIKNN